jgi:hypothetical protein
LGLSMLVLAMAGAPPFAPGAWMPMIIGQNDVRPAAPTPVPMSFFDDVKWRTQTDTRPLALIKFPEPIKLFLSYNCIKNGVGKHTIIYHTKENTQI